MNFKGHFPKVYFFRERTLLISTQEVIIFSIITCKYHFILQQLSGTLLLLLPTIIAYMFFLKIGFKSVIGNHIKSLLKNSALSQNIRFLTYYVAFFYFFITCTLTEQWILIRSTTQNIQIRINSEKCVSKLILTRIEPGTSTSNPQRKPLGRPGRRTQL